jgi:FAD/FMN-containing dehydrogenase
VPGPGSRHAAGRVWDGLRGLRKDNTGYDLRDLFIGAEGTLGVITGAVLKLYPQPKASITALVALARRDALCPAEADAGPVRPEPDRLRADVATSACAWSANTSRTCRALRGSASAVRAAGSVEQRIGSARGRPAGSAIEAALEAGLADDAVVATSIAQSRGLWQLREHIPLAQASAGKNIKHDISLPISRIADFIADTDAQLAGLPRLPGGLLRPPGRRQPALQRRAAGRARAHEDFLANQDGSTASCTTAWPPSTARSRPNTASARSSATNWRATRIAVELA